MSRTAAGRLFAISFVVLTALIFLPQLFPRDGVFEPIWFGWMPSWFFDLSVLLGLNFVWLFAYWVWDGRQGDSPDHE